MKRMYNNDHANEILWTNIASFKCVFSVVVTAEMKISCEYITLCNETIYAIDCLSLV